MIKPASLPVILADRPYTADGFCFDETAEMSADRATRAAYSRQIFCTSFTGLNTKGEKRTFGGNLIASDWAEAEKEAGRRGLGETVEGVLHEVIPGPTRWPL